MIERLHERQALKRLLNDTQAVLLDFDGPITDLFQGKSTQYIADEIKLAVCGVWGTLDEDIVRCNDSHGILRHIGDMYDRVTPTPLSRDGIVCAENIVRRHESDAVRSAKPMAGIGTLVKELRRLRKRLVVVSNNAEGPVRQFLQAHQLAESFESVMGRDPHDPRLMKPDPDSVNRAVKHLGLTAEECLLIGDQLTDLEASNLAGTRFLGYTPSTLRAADMRHRGAEWVVRSHRPVIRVARRLPGPD